MSSDSSTTGNSTRLTAPHPAAPGVPDLDATGAEITGAGPAHPAAKARTARDSPNPDAAASARRARLKNWVWVRTGFNLSFLRMPIIARMK